MKAETFFAAAQGRLGNGTIADMLQTGEILVDLVTDSGGRILCDFLETSDGPNPLLRIGDRVLVMLPATLEQKGCVLGRIGPYVSPQSGDSEPRSVVIEAKKELTLRCGDSVIQLRRDGKLLVKGVEVVSRAKSTNKIKGGSVQIN